MAERAGTDPNARLADILPALCDRRALVRAGLGRQDVDRIFARGPVLRGDDPRARKPYVLRDDVIRYLRVEQAA